METLADRLKLLSKKLRSQQEKIEGQTEWERTSSSPTAKTDKTEEEEKEEKTKPASGKKRLFQVYPQQKGDVCSELLRATKNYGKIISHLEEHVKEDAGDPKDSRQAEQLRKEVERNRSLCGGSVAPVVKDILASRAPRRNPIWKVSNPKVAAERVRKLFGKKSKLYLADDGVKKYKIQRPDGKWVKFGSIQYQDFLSHLDFDRRANYLSRATGMRGNWRDNPYSPNNLAIKVLW